MGVLKQIWGVGTITNKPFRGHNTNYRVYIKVINHNPIVFLMYSHNLYSIVAVYFCTWAGGGQGVLLNLALWPRRKPVPFYVFKASTSLSFITVQISLKEVGPDHGSLQVNLDDSV